MAVTLAERGCPSRMAISPEHLARPHHVHRGIGALSTAGGHLRPSAQEHEEPGRRLPFHDDVRLRGVYALLRERANPVQFLPREPLENPGPREDIPERSRHNPLPPLTSCMAS